MTCAENVARYFIELARSESPESVPITNLHVQKLLYYAQGWALCSSGRRLFDEDIEAWKLGPAIPRVYRVFKEYGASAIAFSEGDTSFADKMSADDKAIIESVWRGYRNFSAVGLAAMTHREQPWKSARSGLRDDENSSRPISLDDLRQFFKAKATEIARNHPHLPTKEEIDAGLAEIEAGGGVTLDELEEELRGA